MEQILVYNESTSKRAKTKSSKNTKKNRHTSFDVYVIRLDGASNLTYAKPCIYCTNTMKCIGVKRIYYSDWEGTIRMEYIDNVTLPRMSVFYEALANQYSHLPVNATKSIRF